MKVTLLAEVSAERVIGGAERVLREQVLGLAARGHTTEVLARLPAGAVERLVQVGSVPEYRYPVRRRDEVTFVLSSLVASLQAFRSRVSPTWPDVVVIHQALAGLSTVLAYPRLPAIYVCHSLAHEEYLSRATEAPRSGGTRRHVNVLARRLIEQIVLRRCRRVIVLSEFMRERVSRVHGVSVRTRLIPGGADVRRFCPTADRVTLRRQLGLPTVGLLLFTVRNLVPRMGLEQLLEALTQLQGTAEGVQLVIGGEGPLRAKLQAMCEALGLTRQVRLVGFIPEAQLPAYYQAADVMVLPTRELEGFGLVTVEALACGTPVVGTPVGAIPEILQRLDGRLVARGCDASALAATLREVVGRWQQDPDDRERLARRARQLVEHDYTWERHCEELDKILREVAGE